MCVRCDRTVQCGVITIMIIIIIIHRFVYNIIIILYERDRQHGGWKTGMRYGGGDDEDGCEKTTENLGRYQLPVVRSSRRRRRRHVELTRAIRRRRHKHRFPPDE